MARLDEIAEGLVAVLALRPMPKPLSLDMMDHNPAEATFLIRAVVDACERRGAPLSFIRLGTALGSNAARTFGPGPLSYDRVAVKFDGDLDRRLEFYGYPEDRSQ